MPLDGATIKPVIDPWGRVPQPYLDGDRLVYPVAYQQILKGYPAIDYSVRDLTYRPRQLRVNRVYGMSPVEQVVTTVNIALRRQLYLAKARAADYEKQERSERNRQSRRSVSRRVCAGGGRSVNFFRSGDAGVEIRRPRSDVTSLRVAGRAWSTDPSLRTSCQPRHAREGA